MEEPKAACVMQEILEVLVEPAAASAALDHIAEQSGHLSFSVEAIRTLQEVRRVTRLGGTDANVPVHTWYIHHGGIHKCFRSRLLILSDQQEDWAHQACALWSDYCDTSVPLQAALVDPQPVHDWTPPTAMHVILHQAPPAGSLRHAILLTAAVAWTVDVAAYSVPELVSCNMVAEQAGLSHLISGANPPYQLNSMWRHEALPNHVIFSPDHGHHLQFVLEPDEQVPPPETEPTSDEQAFLQGRPLTVRKQHARAAFAADCGQSDVGGPDSRCGEHRRVLVLEDLIPDCPVTRHASPQRHFPIVGLDELSSRIIDFPMELQIALPDPDGLKKEVAWELWQCQQSMCFASGPVVHIEIFTDGSCKHREADKWPAWAVVVVFHFASGHTEFQGFAASCLHEQSLVVQCSSIDHQCDAFDAECSAIMFALLWLANCDLFAQGVPATIVADAWSALECALGRWSSHHSVFLAEFVRPLWHAIAQIGCLDGRWQRAHVGNVFNEVADHLAQHFASAQPGDRFHEPITRGDRQPIQWLWMLWKSQLEPFGPFFVGDCLHLVAPPSCGTADLASWPHHDAKQPTTARIEFSCLTFNVSTLKGWAHKPSGGAWTSRQELLFQQVAELHCVCLQETRKPTDCPWKDRGWCGFVGPANKGQGGVEVWLNVRKPFASLSRPGHDPTPVCLSQQGCEVVFADAHILLIHFHTHEFELLIVSAHAPHEASDERSKHQFWTQLARQCQKFPGVPLVGGIDANARTGSHTSGRIGGFHPEPQNTNGELFHEFLHVTDTCAPTTFMSTTWKDWIRSGTWRSVSDWHRIDYPIWPSQWISAEIVAQNDSVSLEHRHEDHVSSAITGRVSVVVEATPALRTPGIDKAAMRTPEGQATCAALLRRFTMQAETHMWQASVDKNTALVEDWFQQALTQAFPVRKRPDKAQWLKQPTFQLQQLSRRARRQMHRIEVHVASQITRAIFLTWKRCSVSQTKPPVLGLIVPAADSSSELACDAFRLARVMFQQWKSWADRYCSMCTPPFSHAVWLKQCHMAWARNANWMRKHKNELARALQADEADFIQQIVERSHSNVSAIRASDFWKKLRPVLPRQKHKAALHKTKFMATDRSFMEHFAAIEQAEVLPLSQLAHSVATGNIAACRQALSQDSSISDLPSVFELECAIRDLKAQKVATGPLAPEVCLADPVTAARMIYPFMLQNAAFYQQSFIHKGGYICPLYKQKGPLHLTDSYRAILLSHLIPKILNHVLRAKIMRELRPKFQLLQLGGLPRMTTTFAVQLLGALRQRAQQQKKSHALVFFDLSAAFYTVRRHDVVDDILQLPDFDLESTHLSAIAQEPAMVTMGASEHLRSRVQQTMSQTWSQVLCGQLQANDGSALRAGRGSRPGDPTADITFATVMTGILDRFMIDAQPHLAEIVQDGVATVVPPLTWMDDIAVYLEADNPCQLIDAVRCVASVMHSRCSEKGLQLNMLSGKSEAILRFQGRGSHSAHRTLQMEPVAQKLEFVSGGTTLHLSLSNAYTHLGQRQSCAMSLDAEISARLARAQNAFQDCRKLLRRKFLHRACKFVLARSLVFSTLLYAAETWTNLTPPLLTKLQSFVMRIFRCILNRANRKDSTHVSDVQVIASVEEPDAEMYIQVARLRHIQKILIDGPHMLTTLLHQQWHDACSGWFSVAADALRWLQLQLPELQDRPDPHADLEHWLGFVRSLGSKWKALCRRGLRIATRVRRLQARSQVWRDLWFRPDMNQEPIVFATPATPGDFSCGQCGKTFATAKALAVHRKTQHNVYAVARHYMPHPTACQSCLKLFGNSQKLRQHLQHGRTGCLQHLQAVLVAMPVEEIDQVQTVSMRKTKDAFRQPALQLYGPRLPTRPEWQEAVPHKQWPLVGRPPVQEADIGCDLVDWFHNDGRGSPPVLHTAISADALADFADYVACFQDDPECSEAVAAALLWIHQQQVPTQGASVPLSNLNEVVSVSDSLPLHFQVLCFGLDDSTIRSLQSFSRNFAQPDFIKIEFKAILVDEQMDQYDITNVDRLHSWRRLATESMTLGTIGRPGSGCRCFDPVHLPTSSKCSESLIRQLDDFGAWQTVMSHGTVHHKSWVALVDKSNHRDADVTDDWLEKHLASVADGVQEAEVITGLFFGVDHSERMKVFSWGLPALTESLHRWKLPSRPPAEWPHQPGHLGAVVEAFYQQAFVLHALRPG
eukprot:Skav217593  [mRNA]  locus=scaffold3512:108064:122800:- [translate_table: standard]